MSIPAGPSRNVTEGVIPASAVRSAGGLVRFGGVMQVRLLGPIDVVVGDELRLIIGVRRRAVLAVLALQAGEVVSIDELVSAAWGDKAPHQLSHPEAEQVRAKLDPA